MARQRWVGTAVGIMTLVGQACGVDLGSAVDSEGPPGSELTPGVTHLTVALTDAPSVDLEAAEVEIGAVLLLPANDDPAITLSEEGGTFNLLDLRDGITAQLASEEIDAGRYRELRLIVNRAHVVLADGLTFADGTTERDIKVPSGAQSGIKVKLRSAADDGGDGNGIVIAPGEAVVIVDFDVSQNFVVQGNPNTPAGLKGILFTPRLRAVVMDAAGSISGTVSTGGTDTVEGITVQAELILPGDDGMDEHETSVATDLTDADGNYTIRFLVPGTYVVTVPDASTEPESVEVEVGAGEDVTGVDFTIGS